MLRRFLNTPDEYGLTIVRVVLGVVMIAHGLQKLFGWFGGHGIGGTIADFEAYFGFPAAVTLLVILAESFGSFFLIVGLATRFMALALGLVMIGAIYFVTGQWSFFMNWYAQPRGEGFEFHILVLGIVLALVLRGGGKWSLDRFILARMGHAAGREP
jgi:putative oxidoreductase